MTARILIAILGIGLATHPGRVVAAEVESLPQISVVKTWGDLLAQKPIKLQNVAKDAVNKASTPKTKKPLTFRLGIDRTASKKNGGVLLYCLAQGDLIQIDQQADLTEQSIGPFLINVRRSHENGLTAEIDAMVVDRFMASHPHALFIKPLPLNDEGSYLITLRQALGGEKFRDVASVKVLVASDQDVSWSPWMEPNGARQAVEPGDEILQEVANPSGGKALPKWDGGEPISFSKLPAEDRLLPEWIAVKPDVGVELELKDNKLIVKLDEEIPTSPPGDFFLTRWWVNDKPITLGPGLARKDTAAEMMSVKTVRKAVFRMEFHPEHLGVKEGDTVGVQLLFCPRGWEWAPARGIKELEQQAVLATRADEDLASKPIARMSNRINFIYLGNPEKPTITP